MKGDAYINFAVIQLIPIRNKKDTDLLRSDLDAVGSWENTWLMPFNADKCFTVRTPSNY